MSEDFERRLIELETKASFQEAALSDMSKLIVEQELRISKLENALRNLRDKVREIGGEGLPPLPENERPPHY